MWCAVSGRLFAEIRLRNSTNDALEQESQVVGINGTVSLDISIALALIGYNAVHGGVTASHTSEQNRVLNINLAIAVDVAGLASRLRLRSGAVAVRNNDLTVNGLCSIVGDIGLGLHAGEDDCIILAAARICSTVNRNDLELGNIAVLSGGLCSTGNGQESAVTAPMT